MTKQANTTPSPDVATLEKKIDDLHGQIALLVEHQRRQQELIDEMMPISREVMRVMTERLADLEGRGYFTFGKASMEIMDRVVTSYSAQDLSELGDNIITILDTVRSATRPEVLQLAHEAAEALRSADENEPMSPWGVWRAASKDKNVRHGVAVMVSLLRQVGRASRRLTHEDKLNKIAPRRLAAPRAAAPQAPPVLAHSPIVAPPEADPASWTPQAAQEQAAHMGITLGELHWRLINFARHEFEETGAAPNVRRLSRGSDVSVRDVYQCFPNSPGVTVATLAGIPKPKGCI
jgi:tRNA 2-thiouridine synthesizing protein E